MRRALAVSFVLALLGGCSSKSTAAAPTGSGTAGATSCDPGAALTGMTYDVGKSKFAFGGTPAASPFPSGGTHYIGPHGAMLIDQYGYVSATMNGDAPENGLADFAGDDAAILQHAKDYFGAMGLDGCQITTPSVLSGGSGSGSSSGSVTVSTSRTLSMNRAVDGIPVFNSMANAEFRAGDVTTFEAVRWPTISADVVSAARALRDQLKDPAKLAAYRAKLPANAQGDGQVVIEHTGFSTAATPFVAVAAWYVAQPYGVFFDANGAAVSPL
jgi:hypothetical protein